MVDLMIHDEGTVVGIQPLSEAGQEWVDENLISEGWQWLGPVLWVDHRLAADIVHGAVRDGIEVCTP